MEESFFTLPERVTILLLVKLKQACFYNENHYEMVETWFSGCIIAIYQLAESASHPSTDSFSLFKITHDEKMHQYIPQKLDLFLNISGMFALSLQLENVVFVLP